MMIPQGGPLSPVSIGPLIAVCCQASITYSQGYIDSDRFVGAGRDCGDEAIADGTTIASRIG